MSLFDEPKKDETGVWKSTTLGRLRKEARAAVKEDPASFLGALGYLTLLKLICEKFEPSSGNSWGGALAQLRNGLLANGAPPKGEIVVDDEGALFVLDYPHPFLDGAKCTKINLVELTKLVETECDRLEARLASGEVRIIDNASIELKAK